MKKKYAFVLASCVLVVTAVVIGLVVGNRRGEEPRGPLVNRASVHYENPALGKGTREISESEQVAQLCAFFDALRYDPTALAHFELPDGGGMYTVSLYAGETLVREYRLNNGRFIQFEKDGAWYALSEQDAAKWDSFWHG